MSLLSLKHLTKTFESAAGPVHAVRDVSLDVAQGECLAIVGESGSGKTTLANMILGILGQTSGEVIFNGSLLSAKRTPDQRRNIQLVQQNPLSSLNPKRSVGASVRLGLDTYRIGEKAERWQTVENALEAVGLPAEMRKRAPAALSGGQRQRVGIARALACEPELLVLDEPTSALDPEMINEVLDVMVELADSGMTMVCVTHEMGFARKVADTMVFMDEGKIIEVAPPEKFFSKPDSERCREFLEQILEH